MSERITEAAVRFHEAELAAERHVAAVLRKGESPCGCYWIYAEGVVPCDTLEGLQSVSRSARQDLTDAIDAHAKERA